MQCPACAAGNDASANACQDCGSSLITVAPGSVIASRYEVEAVTGRGGMGVVFRARDRLLDETVAVKVLRPEIARAPALRDRFRSEIKLARRVRHRHVCAIHEYGEDDGVAYIVMEYVEGITLLRRIRSNGPLPQEEALRIAYQILKGLQAVHDVGIVHRDLKSANLMIDADGLLRLMDFGMAQPRSERGAEEPGVVVGTPEYMSPEQVRGGRADFPSDIYSAGIVIYEAFTGDVPFRGPNMVATLQMQLEEVPPLTGLRAVSIPLALRPVLGKALSKDPDRRFATARGMAHALRMAVEQGDSPHTLTVAQPPDPEPARSDEAAASGPVAGPPENGEARPLVEAMASHDAKVRLWAVLALAEVGAHARSAIPALVQALRDPDAEVAEAANATLESLARESGSDTSPQSFTGPTAPMFLVSLIAMLSDDDAAARWRAAMALGGLGPHGAEAVPALRKTLEDPEATVRWESAQALGKIGSAASGAVPLLIAALNDREDPILRQRAAVALGSIGPAAPAPREDDGAAHPRRPQRRAQAVPALIAALRDPATDVQEAAGTALVTMGLLAVPSLIDAVRDDDARVRSRAADALVAIATRTGSPRSEARAAL